MAPLRQRHKTADTINNPRRWSLRMVWMLSIQFALAALAVTSWLVFSALLLIGFLVTDVETPDGTGVLKLLGDPIYMIGYLISTIVAIAALGLLIRSALKLIQSIWYG